MSDKTTSIQELKDLLEKFKQERNWQQFHDAKNLAEAISLSEAEGLSPSDCLKFFLRRAGCSRAGIALV